jgi:hypothetical protein
MRNTTAITSGAATVYSYEKPVFSFKWWSTITIDIELRSCSDSVLFLLFVL